MPESPRLIYLPNATIQVGSRRWYIRSRFPLWRWIAHQQALIASRKERLFDGHRPR